MLKDTKEMIEVQTNPLAPWTIDLERDFISVFLLVHPLCPSHFNIKHDQ